LTLLRRSAIRVCQPGPVARQRATTSAGNRSEMSCRGFAERGRPPLLTVARESISSVSSGSSRYSEREMRWASTRPRSEFEVRREAGLFTGIGLSHAEDMANRATRCVADNHDTTFKSAVADDPLLTIVLTGVFDLDRDAGKHTDRVFEVKPTICQCLVALGRVVGEPHLLLYLQQLVPASDASLGPTRGTSPPAFRTQPAPQP